MGASLLTALALVLVLEGLLPFLNPKGYQRYLQVLGQVPARQFRIAGLISMLLGCGLLLIR